MNERESLRYRRKRIKELLSELEIKLPEYEQMARKGNPDFLIPATENIGELLSLKEPVMALRLRAEMRIRIDRCERTYLELARLYYEAKHNP